MPGLEQDESEHVILNPCDINDVWRQLTEWSYIGELPLPRFMFRRETSCRLAINQIFSAGEKLLQQRLAGATSRAEKMKLEGQLAMIKEAQTTVFREQE